MQPQEVVQRLGIELREASNLEKLIRYDYRNTYTCNEAGEVIGLNVRSNQLTDEKISFIWTLSDLQVLNLSENALTQLRISATLSVLRYLNISENKGLSQLTFEVPLSALEQLWLEECALTELHFPAGFSALAVLYVQKNKLSKLSFTSTCPNLQLLDASQNELTSFHLPTGFKKLERLFLNDNSLQETTFAISLPLLDTLHLRNNQLPPLEEDFLEPFPKLVSLYLYGNPLQDGLRGQIENNESRNCLEQVKSYFRELSKGKEVDNECKILLIGNGGAGKTCLAHGLIEKQFNPEWNSTDGIQLLKPLLHGGYEFRVWDFGGQDIYHATHRLFMQSRAIYLAVWDWQLEPERKPYTSIEEHHEKNSYPNFGLGYWLDHAKYLGKDQQTQRHSPIIVVQTKRKRDNPQDLPAIRAKYGNLIVNFHHIESETLDWDLNGYNELLISIRKAAKLTRVGAEIPTSWAIVRRAIRKKQQEKQKELSLDAYLQLAEGLENPLGVLEDWLVKTGVVFYRKGLFEDTIILDQQWAIDAVYTILARQSYHYKAFRSQKGEFSGKDLEQIWLSTKMAKSEAECELFLSFMLSCEICFETTEDKKDRYRVPFTERTFVAPQFLDENKPGSVSSTWFSRDAYHVYFEYDFLHAGLIQSFMVRIRSLPDITIDDSWRSGIQIKSKDQLALVEAISGTKTIQIQISRNGWSLLDKIKQVLKSLDSHGVKEWVGLDEGNLVSLATLLTLPAGVATIQNRGGGWVDVKPLQIFLPGDRESVDHQGEFDEKDGFLATGVFRKMGLDAPLGETPGLSQLPADIPALDLPSQSRTAQVNDANGKILFVTANPTNEANLQTGVEYRRLKAEFERGNAGKYEFLPIQLAVTIEELVRAMHDQPQLIHFAGHGSQEGIMITNDVNEALMVPTYALRRLFQPLQGITRIVILNACYSAEQAQVISAYGSYVIGHNMPVKDTAAINFSIGFYTGLGQGKSFEAAYNDAMIVLATKNPYAIKHIEVWKDGEKRAL